MSFGQIAWFAPSTGALSAIRARRRGLVRVGAVFASILLHVAFVGAALWSATSFSLAGGADESHVQQDRSEHGADAHEAPAPRADGAERPRRGREPRDLTETQRHNPRRVPFPTQAIISICRSWKS